MRWITPLLIVGLTSSPVLASPASTELPGLVDDSFEAPVELLSDAPVVDEPPPSGVVQPRDTQDAVTLLIVAAGGFAVGALAGVMGCCVLFFAFYY